MTGSARRLTRADFDDYDLILAVDRRNLGDIQAVARRTRGAPIHLLREFDPAPREGRIDVPDPYYGGDDGFEHVLDLVDAACGGLLDGLRADGRR